MKSYIKPKHIELGTCFICKTPCNPNSYCHRECAIAFDSEKQRLLDEAKIESLKLIIEEKDKLLYPKSKPQ